jgi:hypothetical protein
MSPCGRSQSEANPRRQQTHLHHSPRAFWVSEHRIRFGNFFASLFGIRPFVAIGVVAQRELAKRILDRPLLGVAGNPEDFIVSRAAAWS